MTEQELTAKLVAKANALVDSEREWDDAKTFAHHYLQECHWRLALLAERDAIGINLDNAVGQLRTLFAEREALKAHLARYLDQHCAVSDQDGLGALCECSLCRDVRRVQRDTRPEARA